MNNRVICIIAICVCAIVNVVITSSVLAEEENYNYNYAALKKKCRVYDPYQAINRPIFIFNGVLDTFILRPITKGYAKVTNDYTKTRIGSFVYNIGEPLSAVNCGIQGDTNGVFKSFWRFMINSTIGVGGLFDIAAKFGLKSESQTFGNTLAHYGVGPGPYIVLPIYGGMGMRDVMDAITLNSSMNPVKYAMHRDFKYASAATKMVYHRDEIMPFTDHVSKTSTDSYIAIRNALMNKREAKMIYPENFKCPVINRNG